MHAQNRADIVVIGAGAVGVAFAYFVKVLDASVDVVVVERDPSYTLASTPRAAGGLRRLFSLPENIALSNFGVPFFAAIPEAAFRKNGYLLIVPSEHREQSARNFETQRDAGCDVVWMEPDELRTRWPSMRVDDLAAGVHSPQDGWIDPHGALAGLRSMAAALGVRFVRDEVVGIERDGNLVRAAVVASGEALAADHFVNAAGAWAMDVCALLGERVPIAPLRRFEHCFVPEEPIEPLPVLVDSNGLVVRPSGEGYVVSALEAGAEHEVHKLLARRFAPFERITWSHTIESRYGSNLFDGSTLVGPGLGGLANFHLMAGIPELALVPGCGRALAELIVTGAYRTIDLTRFGWQRVLDDAPLRETGTVGG